MPLPVLLAVDEDRDALEDVETHLVRRYGRDYRVECLGDPEEALRLLTELAHAGRRRHRWAGQIKFADPQLPWLSQGRQRQLAR
jgi:hypothetical protein